jgi:hypothetical protein
LAVKTIEEAIAENLAASPPLTEEQIKRLRGLLRTSPAHPAYVHPQYGPQPAPTVNKKRVRIKCEACGLPYPPHYYKRVQHEMIWPEGVEPHSDLANPRWE